MPRTVTVAEIKKLSSLEKFLPVYVTSGGEPLLLDIVVKHFTSLVDESTRDFNFDIYYGDKLDPQRMAASLGAMPMMAEKRVVLIKRADNMTPTSQKYLAEYVKNPVSSTVLVLLLDGEGKQAWIKKISNESTLINCNTPRGKALEGWIFNAVKELNVEISPEAVDLITEGRTVRLIDIAGELLKASLLIEEGETITIEVLQEVWGIEPEVNIWGFFDKVASGKRLDALRDIEVMRDTLEKDQGSGFIFSQVARRWRLAWKEKVYDSKKIAFSSRDWSGNTKRQWQMASADLKSLPQEVSEKELARMLELDRTRKTRSFDAICAFERLIHKTALDRQRTSK